MLALTVVTPVVFVDGGVTGIVIGVVVVVVVLITTVVVVVFTIIGMVGVVVVFAAAPTTHFPLPSTLLPSKQVRHTLTLSQVSQNGIASAHSIQFLVT